MGAFKPLMMPPNGSYHGSIALWGGAPMKKRVSLSKKVDNFLFQVGFFPMVDLLTSSFDCKIQSFLIQLLHIRSVDNLEQKTRPVA